MWTTYPFKSADKGTAYGSARIAATRKEAAVQRNEACQEKHGNTRAWSGAITYTPAGSFKLQTQSSPVA